MSILEWLGLAPAAPRAAEGEVVRRIVAELESMEPAQARLLALFAFLLARVANVDLEISADETREMERIVETHGGLRPAQAALVVEIAKAENRLLGPTHNFVVAREFRDLAGEEQKRALLDCLFAVAAADGAVSVAEEEEIRVVSRALLLDEADYLSIRSGYKHLRAVLKRD
jgi:uncharacterized tellurite resistance protein B-like protein